MSYACEIYLWHDMCPPPILQVCVIPGTLHLYGPTCYDMPDIVRQRDVSYMIQASYRPVDPGFSGTGSVIRV